MKRNFISLLALMIATQVVLAVDQNYYSSLNGKQDGTLRSAVTSLVYTHHTTAVGYNWSFDDIDIVDHEVLDMYSTCSWTEVSDQCGNYSGVCGCYNREHTVPQSLFGEKSPQVGDRHHLFLTDGKVNAVRSNYAFGETNNTTTWDAISNGSSALGQLGKASYAYNSSVTVYEPDDQYKGDIARAILYMAIRYATSNECRAYSSGSGNEYPVTAWSSNEMFSGSLSTNYGLSDAAVQTFLKWHREDKVSAKEIARNTGVENLQHNRNPFVDYPILVEYLWGEKKGQSFDVSNAVGSFETAFVPGVSDGSKASEEEDYYQSLVGKKDAALRSALTYLLYSKHTLFDKYGSSGTANWDFPFDYDENGYVWDIYTKDCNMTKDQGSTSSCCCTGLNREHLVCQSTFGGSSNMDKIPQYCDRHSLFLTDARTNQIRNDQAFGECDAEGATIGNGTNCTECTDHALGRKGKVTTYADLYESTEDIYEPGDEFKGDIARAILYMVVRYAEQQYCRLPDGAQYCAASGGGDVIASLTTPNEHYTTTWKNKGTSTATTIGQMFSTSLDVNYGLSAYGKAILLKWHRQDPVSKKEIDRNAGVEAVQGNRNPFIDHPELVEYLWGELQGQSYVIGDVPVPTTKYTITWSVDGETSTEQVTENEKPSAPSVTNCSESRVFVGWTTSSTVSEKPAELYTAATIPAATKAATYYAVYADKETEDGGGDFALYNGELTEGDYVVYYNGKAMKAAASDNKLAYETVTANNNKIATKDASIIWHLSQTNGYWTIYNAGEAKYAASTGTKNQARLLADGTDDCSQWTVSGASTYEFVNKNNSAKGVNANLRNNGTYGFACYSTQTGGALSLYKQSGSVTYTNYGLSCSTVKKVTITYHSNDGKDEVRQQETLQNTETELDANPFVRTHYSFEGWSLSAGGSKAYSDGGIIVPTADVDLYAVWKEYPKYTLTFRNGEAVHMSVTDYAGEAIVGLTDPKSCERYSFVGWSATQYPADNTEEPVTGTPSIVPEVNQIYYAVYKQEVNIPGTASVPVGTTLWAEDFSGYTSGAAPSDAVGSSHTGTTVYGENSVTYACKNGATDTKIYNENYAKGEKPEIMIAKGDGAFSVSGIPTGGAKEMTLSFKVNKTQISYCGVSSPTEGIQIGTQTIAGGEYTCDIQNNTGVAFFDIVITNSNSGTNGREDDFLLLIKTAGGTPDVHITYYTTAPDCSPVIIPEYTVTFMNGDEKHDEIIGQAGEGIFVYDPTPACEAYTFYGWSENQYSATNTDKPAFFVPTVIPNEDKTYYAVYTKNAEAGMGLINQYKKITREDELTNANYLVVADTSKLLAMSTDWKNTYYLGSVEVAENDGVITTDNSKIVWQITGSKDELTFENVVAGYLYIEQSINGEKTYYNIKLGTNTTANKFSCEVNDGVWVFGSVTYPDRQIEYYKAKAYWSYFNGQDAPIYLYKQQEGIVHKTYYSTTLDCSEGPSTALESEEVRVTARKMLINGQLYIVLCERVYDITGQRVR